MNKLIHRTTIKQKWRKFQGQAHRQHFFIADVNNNYTAAHQSKVDHPQTGHTVMLFAATLHIPKVRGMYSTELHRQTMYAF